MEGNSKMEFDIEERKRQLESFSSFIDDSYSRIDKMLNDVGWTREYLLNQNAEMVECPLNSGHKMPKKSLEAHILSCALHKEGYDNQDIFFQESSSAGVENTTSTIVIDAELQTTIIKEAKKLDPLLLTGNLEADGRLVPRTSNRLLADFTCDERRVLYDYVISKTNPIGDVKVEELQMIDEMNKDEKPRPKSELELLIEERDAKRRRISYRKKVHTNRKSQTEIMREVIQNQMELLEQIIKGESGEDRDEKFSTEHEQNADIFVEENPAHCSRSINEEMKETSAWEQAKSYSKDYIDRPYHMGRRYDNYVHDKTRTFDSKDGSSYGNRGRGWNGKRGYKEHNMESTSFENTDSAHRHNYEVKGWERRRDHRYDTKTGNYHQSKRFCSDIETSSETKYYKNSSKYENEGEIEYEDYSRSRHHRNSSKHSSPEYDMEYGKDYYRHPNRHKSSSKHNPEHYIEDEKEYGTHKSRKSKFPLYNNHDDESRDSYDSKTNKRKKPEENTHCGSKVFMESEGSKHETVSVEDSQKRENISSDSERNKEKSKRTKKKKSKKHHKHKSKKSRKRKRSSDRSSTKSDSSCIIIS